ncbi:2646_t:CDS:2 [Funneliformis mosseae]|uniref:2646_t:CDS:1 n=1 Tax=Funneliformis mosseae TaxID=27381 RepID=A0A9N9C7D5_FUNMO|nr:2646_t:CDS:2 [Funneliformis mosseae]
MSLGHIIQVSFFIINWFNIRNKKVFKLKTVNTARASVSVHRKVIERSLSPALRLNNDRSSTRKDHSSYNDRLQSEERERSHEIILHDHQVLEETIRHTTIDIETFETLNRNVLKLTEKVNKLKKRNSSFSDNDNCQLSSELKSGYKQQFTLKDITEEQYKVFHDNVVTVLERLDESLQLDYTKKWTEISQDISRNMIKEIDKKKERKQKGLTYIFNTNDAILTELRLICILQEKFKEDYETIMNKGKYYSDEVSETDKDLCDKEIDQYIRPKNKKKGNKHVLHVYDKKWRSSCLRSLLHKIDKVDKKISHIKTT